MTALTATGAFHQAALAPAAPRAAEPAASGKPAPAGGKDLPAGAAADDRRALERVARELEKHLQTATPALHFEIDLEGGQAVIQVFDRETGELIRRIPREKVSPFIAARRRLDLRLFDDQV